MSTATKLLDTASAVSPPAGLDAWRRQVPLLRELTPMNHCTQAPQTEATRAAAEAYLDSWRHDGVDWDGWMDEVERAKVLFAELIGATPEEIAVTTSVSNAAAQIASALEPSGARRRVVLSGAEFPAVGHAFLAQERRGIECVWVPRENGAVPLEGYARALDRRVLAVAACHASYQDGIVQDIAAIARLAHDAGALVFVDAYQTVGIRSLDVRELGIDVLVSGNLKFLMGIPGIAFLYVRRSLIERLEPLLTGWLGRARPFEFHADRLDWAPDARRFESGTPPILPAYVARAGMEIIHEVGPAVIESWTSYLSRRLLDGAATRGFEVAGLGQDPQTTRDKTPLTAIICPPDAASDVMPPKGGGAASGWTTRAWRPSDRVEEALRQRRVLASARGETIRLTPHFYSTPEDVDHALDKVVEVFER